MSSQIGSVICCMAGCLGVLALPFIVCDLYYAYNDTICVALPILNPSVSFTLGTWLLVSGYLQLAMISMLFLIAIIACCSPKGLTLFIGYLLLTIIVSLFNIAWLIVGAVMFWGYLYKQDLCSNSAVNSYMFARLILGFISVFVNLLTSRRQKTQAEGS